MLVWACLVPLLVSAEAAFMPPHPIPVDLVFRAEVIFHHFMFHNSAHDLQRSQCELLISLLWQSLGKSSLRKEGIILAYGLRVYSPTWWERQQEQGGSWSHGNHTQDTSNSKCWCSIAFPFSFSSGRQPLECCHPHLVWVFLAQLMQSKNWGSANPEVNDHCDSKSHVNDSQDHPSQCLS